MLLIDAADGFVDHSQRLTIFFGLTICFQPFDLVSSDDSVNWDLYQLIIGQRFLSNNSYPFHSTFGNFHF
jgi:hypothetical protein